MARWVEPMESQNLTIRAIELTMELKRVQPLQLELLQGLPTTKATDAARTTTMKWWATATKTRAYTLEIDPKLVHNNPEHLLIQEVQRPPHED